MFYAFFIDLLVPLSLVEKKKSTLSECSIAYIRLFYSVRLR